MLAMAAAVGSILLLALAGTDVMVSNISSEELRNMGVEEEP